MGPAPQGRLHLLTSLHGFQALTRGVGRRGVGMLLADADEGLAGRLVVAGVNLGIANQQQGVGLAGAVGEALDERLQGVDCAVSCPGRTGPRPASTAR